MTDPLVEFRDLAADDLDGIYLEVTRGFLAPPTVRGVDYVIAAAAGRSSGNRVADVLPLLLEGYVAGDDPADWRANTDQLLTVLDEAGKVPGVLTVRAPLFGLDPGSSATINARVKNFVQGPIIAETYQTWSIELESVDPYWVIAP